MQNLRVSYEPVAPYIPLEALATKLHEAPRKARGLAASPGIVEGRCTIIRDLEDLHTLQDGTILVCEAASPKLAPFMPLLRGLVAERGGPLCIASGYAREYEVPSVVGVKGIMDGLHNGDFIRIDGARGVVDVIRQ